MNDISISSNYVGEIQVRKSPIKVNFDSIEIMSFPLLLGDNPAVTEGAPVTIGWVPSERTTMDLLVYEFTRQKEKRRRGKRLMIPAIEREVMLLSNGYGMNNILEASIATDKIRRERLRTVQGVKKWDRFNAVLENARSRFKVLKVNSSKDTPVTMSTPSA